MRREVDEVATLRVLLLEDSAGESALVEAHMAETLPEAQPVVVRTLAEALAELAARPFDAVLADLSVPDADGLDVVEALRGAAADTALVVLTGRADGVLARRALGCGAQDYLVKGRDDGPRLTTALVHAVQRARVEREARRYERMARSLLDALDAPTCAVDASSRIVAVNAAWRAAALAGGADPDVVGQGSSYLAACDAAAGDDDAAAAGDVAAGLRDVLGGASERYQREYACHGPEEPRWFLLRIAAADVDGGRGAVITHVDVTEMHRVQEALAHQALHDSLTGLPNRLLLTDRLAQALVDCGRRETVLGVAFLDLDRFKQVNDSLGHSAGDELLAQVSARLRAQLRASDTLARFSGDEFVVVWRDLEDPSEAAVLCARLTDALAAPFDLGTATVTVTASIGLAVGCAPQTAEELLVAADAAMYDAKGRGRGRVRTYSSELRQGVAERMATELGLRDALDRDQLVLHYQPVVDVASGRPTAVEALVRWQHPERGLVAPDLFIAVAESSGLIVPLGRWVLEEACRQAASWTGELADLDVAVNLSVRQLTQPDVLAHVRDALGHSGLPPDRLILEVTESAVMEDAEAAGIALDALARLGVRIAIDDFGTGYSSLLYLRRYPIRALKVDRAFVSGVAEESGDAAIVTSIVALAHAVGATSIAEGVETVEQLQALRAVGCLQAQGYLWSRPVSAGDLPAAVERAPSVLAPHEPPVPAVPEQRVEASVPRRVVRLPDVPVSRRRRGR